MAGTVELNPSPICRKPGAPTRPLFSISVLCLNNLEFTQRCLSSVLECSTLSFELIATDNGSSDGTHDYLKSLSLSDRRARAIRHARNLGFIQGHEIALRNARGKYFLLLNNDVEVGPGWLEKILAEFDDPSVRIVGAVGCRLDARGRGMHYSGVCDYIEGSCLAIPAAFARFIGLFDPLFEIAYCEDSDLCLRVRAMGHEIRKANIAIRHRVAVSMNGNELDVQGYSIKNHDLLRRKWGVYLSTRSFKEDIVVNRAGAVGDVLLLSPIFEHMKRENVHRRITLITRSPQLMEGNPFVDSIVGSAQGLSQIRNLDLSYEKRPDMHIVDAYALELDIRDLKCRLPKVMMNDEDKDYAGELCPENYVVLHTGPTAWPGRNLPLETFQKVHDDLKDQGYRTVEIGLQPNLKNADAYVIGQSFKRVAAVIRNATGFVGIDSAPMHIAQAFLKPGAVPFGCINPEYRIIHPHILRPVVAERIGCKFCHHWREAPRTYSDCLRGKTECMERISWEQMVSAFSEGLRSKALTMETSKIRERVLKYCEGKGIDIGCRDDKIKPDALGIDRDDFPGVDLLRDASLRLPFGAEEFDYVYSSHCLEDIEDTEAALREWVRVLRKRACIVLQLPYKHAYKGANVDHMHRFVPGDITSVLSSLRCDIIESFIDRGEDRYSFVVVGRKR